MTTCQSTASITTTSIWAIRFKICSSNPCSSPDIASINYNAASKSSLITGAFHISECLSDRYIRSVAASGYPISCRPLGLGWPGDLSIIGPMYAIVREPQPTRFRPSPSLNSPLPKQHRKQYLCPIRRSVSGAGYSLFKIRILVGALVDGWVDRRQNHQFWA